MKLFAQLLLLLVEQHYELALNKRQLAAQADYL
jgi:hypothetical protein